MEYRTGTPEDTPLLAEMNHRLIRDEGHRNRMTIPQLEARMAAWLAAEYEAVLFTAPQSGVTGYALFRDDGDYIYLRQLFVEAEHRRRGVGRGALEWLIRSRWAGRRIRVEVLVGNEPALAFWRSVGFGDYQIALEREPTTPSPGGQP